MFVISALIIIILFFCIFANGYLVCRWLFSKKPRIEIDLIDCFIIGFTTIIMLQFFMSLLDLGLTRIGFNLYYASGLIGIVFYIKENRRILSNKMKNDLLMPIKNKTYHFQTILILIIVAIAIVLFSITVFFPKMNWDGYTFYLKDMGLILNSDANFGHIGEGIQAFVYDNFSTSYVTSLFFAYFGNIISFDGSTNIEKLVFYNETFGFAIFIVFILLLLSLYRLGNKMFSDKIFSLMLILIFICMPAIHQYMKYSSLSSDLIFVFLLTNLVFYLIKYQKNLEKNTPFILAIMAIVTLTKINGLATAILLIFIILLNQIKLSNSFRKFTVCCVFILLFLLFSFFNTKMDDAATSSLNSSYLFEPINICVIIISFTIFVYSFLINASNNSEEFDFNINTLLRNQKLIFVGFILIVSILMVPFIYFLSTGSPFGSYVQALSDSERIISHNIHLALGDFWDAKLTKNYYYGILGAGFEFGVLFILILYYLKSILKSENKLIIPMIVCLFLLFLVWVFIFHSISTRHLLLLTIFLSICMISIISLIFKENKYAAITILLFLIIFTQPLLSSIYYEFNVLDYLKIFKSHWNWSIIENLLMYGAYLGLVTGFILCLSHLLQNISDTKTTHLIIHALFGCLILINIIVLIEFYDRSDLRHYSSAILYNDYLDVLDFVNTNISKNSTIAYYHGFGVEFFTNHNYKYFKMLDFKAISSISSSGVVCMDNWFSIIPSNINPRYYDYKKFLILTNTTKYFVNSTVLYSNDKSYWEVHKIYGNCFQE